MDKKNHYFDYASTTPLDKRVFEAMKPFFTDVFGNPSSLYSIGQEAKKAMDIAIKKITDILGCKPEEFIFTASATESNNLALLGIARANKKLGNKIIISNVEHKSILTASQALAKEGYEIVGLPINKSGLVNPAELAKLLDKKTILVSVIYADSETGTIQPIKKLGKVIAESRRKHNRATPYFHTDASQAANFLDINANNLGVDLMTLSAPKIYGPKGTGGLYLRHKIAIEPLIYGGGQQHNIRPGTENVPGIVGFGEAIEIALKDKSKEQTRLEKLRNKLEVGILEKIDKVFVNGNQSGRLPNFSNLSILGVDGETLLLYLDAQGIIVNTGSACNSRTSEPSYILGAFGRSDEYIRGSIRFTLGRKTTGKDVDYVLKNLPPIVKKLRGMSSPKKL